MNNRKLRTNIFHNSLDGLYTEQQEIKATRICVKLSRRINKPSNNINKCIADYQYLCE